MDKRAIVIPTVFSHNGYEYEVEYLIENAILVASATILPTEKHGPLVYKFKITADELQELPFMPKKIYDESILEPLKSFLIKHIDFESARRDLRFKLNG